MYMKCRGSAFGFSVPILHMHEFEFDCMYCLSISDILMRLCYA